MRHAEHRKRHRRRSIRLKGYDYAQPGSCFVTICAHRRKCIFGEVENGALGYSCLGRLVELCWRDIPKHFPATNVDVFQIMPNHLHGIITIKNPVGVELVQPLQVPSFQHVVPNSLGSIVRSFKAAVTRRARDEEQWGRDALWQRNYFEHIIRDDVSFFWIQRYIEMNPQLWDSDYDNPHATDRTEDYLEEGLRRRVGDNNQGIDHIMSCEVAYRRWLVKEEEAIA